jgi:hypothetical protein
MNYPKEKKKIIMIPTIQCKTLITFTLRAENWGMILIYPKQFLFLRNKAKERDHKNL